MCQEEIITFNWWNRPDISQVIDLKTLKRNKDILRKILSHNNTEIVVKIISTLITMQTLKIDSIFIFFWKICNFYSLSCTGVFNNKILYNNKSLLYNYAYYWIIDL